MDGTSVPRYTSLANAGVSARQVTSAIFVLVLVTLAFYCQKSQVARTTPYPMVSDVVGCDEAKQKVIPLIHLLKDGSLGSRRMVFEGAKGTGKRMLARAVAHESDAKFVEIDLQALLGFDGPERATLLTRQLLEESSLEPSVIFVRYREIGRKIGRRGFQARLKSGDAASLKKAPRVNDEEDNLMQALLEQHDRTFHTLVQSSLIIVSTRRADSSSGTLRAWEKTRFSSPDRVTRAELFKAKLKDVDMNMVVHEERWFDKLAERSLGLSGDDISRLCDKTKTITLSRNNRAETVQEAMEQALMEKSVPAEWERNATAYHEAAHAVFCWFLRRTNQLETVSIIPENEDAMECDYGAQTADAEEALLSTAVEVFNDIVIFLAGRSSEKHFLGRIRIDGGCTRDLQAATELGYLAVTDYGVYGESDVSFEELSYFGRIYGKREADSIDQKVQALMNKAFNVANAMVIDYKDQIEMVAKALLVKEVLSANELATVLGPASPS